MLSVDLVGVEGGECVGDEGGGCIPIYGIVRVCKPNGPFLQCCRYMISPNPTPFFNKKYMTDPIFQDSYVKGPTFGHPGM